MKKENLQPKSTKQKIVFKKSNSRETTLFMQSLWAKAMSEGIVEKFGWENPYLPFVVHYVNDGVVEIWEHEKAIKWFHDRLFKEIKNDNVFLTARLKEYKKLVVKIKKIHSKLNFKNEAEIKAYTKLIYLSILCMSLFYYVGLDERMPKNSMKIAFLGRQEYDLFAKSDHFIRDIIAKIGKIPKNLASFVLPEEIFSMPSLLILRKRQKHFLLIDGWQSYSGTKDDYLAEHPKVIFEDIKIGDNIMEISGQSAYKGKIQGYVRIVRKKIDLKKVKKGDVIVSPMTSPDYLSAMKKSAAFVTDEGGITCHAAIIAREMKKPCIIGTKIATKVLNDGDLVEVNADFGIVKIIK